ncbi:MAG: hypothetical protein PVI09_23475 [Anaerolineae bacterium]|jgi:hypothetical protein
MSEQKKQSDKAPKRQYPPIYERAIPLAMGAIAVLIIVLLLVVAIVLFGLFPGTGQ